MAAGTTRQTGVAALLSLRLLQPFYEMVGADGYTHLVLRDALAGGDVGVCDHGHRLIRLRSEAGRPLAAMLRGDLSDGHDHDLVALRSALHALLHEAIHSLLPGGLDPGQRFARQETLPVRAIEVLSEGTTELLTLRITDHVIDELGLEELAPGLAQADSHVAYVPQLLAVNGLLRGIAHATGQDMDEVTVWMLRHGGKPLGYAGLLDRHLESVVVDARMREMVVDSILQAVSEPLAVMHLQLELAGDPHGTGTDTDLHDLGRTAGAEAAERLGRALEIVADWARTPTGAHHQRLVDLCSDDWALINRALVRHTETVLA